MSLGIHPSGLSQRPWVLDLVEKRGRVDVVRIGDSNENKGDANTNTTNAYNPSGTAWGWNHGFAHALHRMGFPCYGSGFASPFDNGGNGTHEGYGGHVSPVAAGEAAIGLAILVIYFRGRGTIAVDDVNRMKG